LDWHTKAIDLYSQGTTIADIHKQLKSEGFEMTYGAVKKTIYRHNKRFAGEKQGKEELKPKIEDFGDYYIVTSGKRTIRLEKSKLSEIKKLYCGDDPLTINTICRKLHIPRPDFIVIKTAFSITHDDVPYIDEELTDDNIDNLVESTLERRKEKYFLKLQETEINDLRKEVAKYREKDYAIGKIDSMVQKHIEDFAKGYEGPVALLRIPEQTGKMLEVSVVDLHLGKLAWEPETGENYDSKIAVKRFMSVIHDVAERTKGMEFEKVILPLGNDFFNFDDIEGATTNGTPQDNDSRWQKLFDCGIEVLIRAIDILATIAPVEAFCVPGNHDFTTSYYAVKTISAWFRNNQNVTVNTNPRSRKYIEFGNNLIGFTHTDKEKKRIFGCMQIEAREAWGRTLYHEWHGAHLHSEQVKEDMGVIVRNLSSVTGMDAWHSESGYVGAIAKSQSFIWDKTNGLENIIMKNIER
jgi:hypothetical protein